MFILFISLLVYTFSVQNLSADITNSKEFATHCNFASKTNHVDSDKKSPEHGEEQHKNQVCEAYVAGYLDVANHNCLYDFYRDNLHKLNTKNISIEQIKKALEIYFQQLSKNGYEGTIDHLWRALNPHWPCNH